jgi:hypothetical protein
MKLQVFILLAILTVVSVQTPIPVQKTAALSPSVGHLARYADSSSPNNRLPTQDGFSSSDNQDIDENAGLSPSQKIQKAVAIIGTLSLVILLFAWAIIHYHKSKSPSVEAEKAKAERVEEESNEGGKASSGEF